MQTAVALARLKAESDALMTSSALIQTLTRTNDGQGGTTESWSSPGVTTKCRLVRRRVSEVSADGARRIAYYLELAVPLTVTLDVGQRVTVSGQVYLVTSVAPADFSVARRAIVEAAT